MAAFNDKSDMDKLSHVNNLVYKDQAIWFMNAYWEKGINLKANPSICEDIYHYHQTCVKLDKSKKEDGCELDEFQAHQLVEKVCDDALTVQKMREVLKEIDVDFNKMVSLTEFMIYKFSVDWKELANAPQSTDMSAINSAQEALSYANEKLDEAISASTKAKDDAAHAKHAEEKAKEEEVNSARAAESAKTAEANLKEAKAQNEAALEELNLQEKTYNDKCDKLEEIGSDETLGVVKKNKAKAELAILKSEDPMPLRMAKIHQEAAVRKVTKATVKAGAATAAAETAAKLAVEARHASEQAYAEATAAARAAENAIPIAQAAFAEAERILEDVKKNNSGSGEGNLWYIDRELEEKKKFLPKSKFASAAAAAELAKQKLQEN